MRRGALVLLLASACRAVGPGQSPPPSRGAAAPSTAPATPPIAAPVDASAPVEAPEPALAWGTRPSKSGPLYPVVDGMCIHAEAWTLEGASILTWGNATDGGFSRGTKTTFARFTDDGLDIDETELRRSIDPKNPFGWSPMMIAGTWPSPLVAYSGFVSGNRLGQPMGSIWLREDRGWKLIASSDERKDAPPFYLWPVYFQGHVIVPERLRVNESTMTTPIAYRAVPPLAGIAALNHDESNMSATLAANDDAIYALASSQGRTVLREWRAGKATNLGPVDDQTESRIVLTKPNVVVVSGAKVFVLESGKIVTVAPPLPAKARVTGVAAAPNGDLWIAESTNTRVVVAKKDGPYATFDVLAIPPPATARPSEEPQHVALVGGPLAGVEHDDAYAIGKVGTLFHFEAGVWNEVPLPAPPWSTNRYRAQSLAMPAKGDLFVNAGYAEKSLGWAAAERYRAILRTKRPKEILRCNEPAASSGYESGAGFMSFPPYADDGCTTPFVVILRTALGLEAKPPMILFDRKAEFPSVRDAIKATPSLGESTDLVELTSGNQRYLGAAVPSVAAGRELVAALAKRVKVMPPLRPEIVCGTPPAIERTLTVSRPR